MEEWASAPQCVKAAAGAWEPPDVDWEPRELPGLQWANMDVKDPVQRRELYEFLRDHYVRGEKSRLHYSEDLLEWALAPPGYKRSWHLCLRGPKHNVLATITAVPHRMEMGQSCGVVGELDVAVINFLCVHPKLRAKRLAPVLIQEITRRIAQKQVWYAVYTAAANLPNPVASPCYSHLPIDVKHLVATNFLPRDIKVPRPFRTNMDLRPVCKSDVEPLFKLYNNFMDRHKPDMAFRFTDKSTFKHAIMGKATITLLTNDCNNFLSFFILHSHSDQGPLHAAYLMHFIHHCTHPHLLLHHATRLLPAHLLNCLNTQGHHFLHSHTPLHFFLYNLTHSTPFTRFTCLFP